MYLNKRQNARELTSKKGALIYTSSLPLSLSLSLDITHVKIIVRNIYVSRALKKKVC